MLKEMLDETKKTGVQYKDDQNQLIENLRLQLNETREMIVKKITSKKDTSDLNLKLKSVNKTYVKNHVKKSKKNYM